jgi:hypothetical protein
MSRSDVTTSSMGGRPPAARVYISGPISGMKDSNRHAFLQAESLVEECGHIPVNPQKISAEHEGPCRGADNVRHPSDTRLEVHKYGCYMGPDLRALLDCDILVHLPGWTDSRGAILEHNVAEACGIQIVLPTHYLPGALRRWRERQLSRNVGKKINDRLRDTQDATAQAFDNYQGGGS